MSQVEDEFSSDDPIGIADDIITEFPDIDTPALDPTEMLVITLTAMTDALTAGFELLASAFAGVPLEAPDTVNLDAQSADDPPIDQEQQAELADIARQEAGLPLEPPRPSPSIWPEEGT